MPVHRTLYTAIAVCLIIAMSGCCILRGPGIGQLNATSEARRTFEKYEVNPAYRYYFSGPEYHPTAILGLDKTYNLESGVWKPVEMTREHMKGFVTGMQDKVIGRFESPWGFAILDDGGRQIGAWYSILSAVTSVRIKDGKTAVIYTPDIDVYLKLERESQ